MDSIGRSGGKLLLVPKIKELNRLTNEIQAGFVLFCSVFVWFFLSQTWRAERMRSQ